MYAWIWRHLPFGRLGKSIISLGLILATTALLWYVVFPWAEPFLPFDDVQVTQDDGEGTAGTADDPQDAGVGATASPEASLGEHDIPYSTRSNSPSPSRGSR